MRELFEESGQVADGALRFVGHAGFVLAPEQRREYGALFAGDARTRRDFEPNDEIAAIRWWDLRSPLPGRIALLDVHLARLARESVSRPAEHPLT